MPIPEKLISGSPVPEKPISRSSVPEKLISRSVDFIKVVGSLVSGFTALFYAAGFLAWNSRMAQLGMPEPEIVNINYLLTGAKFFVFLPLRFAKGLGLSGWGWMILPVIAFMCIALIGIRDHSKRFSRWAFAAAEIILLALLLIPLMEEVFVERLIGLGEKPALFSDDVPQIGVLEDDYSKLVVLTVFAFVGIGLTLSWQRKIEEAISPSGTEAESSSSEPREEDRTERRRSFWFVISSNMTPWKVASSIVPISILFVALLYILMLTMNYVYPVFATSYPVVNVQLKEIYPEIKPTTKLYLLKQGKGGGGNLLLYSRDLYKIFQTKEADIKELIIIGHEPIWKFNP